jgi:CysZ protein
MTVERRGAFREFLAGVGLLFRGLRVWATAPRLMVLGMLPALIVGAVVVAGVLSLAANIEGLAEWATPFASRWDEPWRTGIRVVIGLSLLSGAVLLVIYTFTTVTLIIGDPFYERIWRHVEGLFGPVPEEGARGFWRSVGVGIVAGLRILLPTLGIGLVVVLLGFIPLVGPILGPAFGALFGGWFLAGELTSRVFDARGIPRAGRRNALRGSRAATVGFGAAVWLTFLIPFGAVVMMPAAVAGATLLGRRALGEVSTPPARVRRAARIARDRIAP